MLWLALHFPLLPLEALPWRRSPSAVVQRGQILACDRLAATAGVIAGQKLSTALGLVPNLAIGEYDAASATRALSSLACWAGRFTPTLSLLPPTSLLLEIGACLRLFGGSGRIAAELLAGCEAQAYSVCWAAAPTPLAAFWLARAGQAATFAEMTAVHGALAHLPCAVAGWPSATGRRLEAFGLRRLGDLRALPTATLRRRIGTLPVDDLARAWGDIPHLLPPFVFPENFQQTLELPARVEHAEALAFACQRLLAALAGWLQARQRLLRACSFQLIHTDGPASTLPLRFAEPHAEEHRFTRLLREHLARLTLAEPVEAIALTADETVARSDESASLFAAAAVTGEGAAACLERLQARLGSAVHVLGVRPDHRPECATTSAQPGTAPNGPSAPPCTAPRPLGLLPAPLPLAERDGRPCWHGPLQLLTRGERLESGWWDEGESGAAGDLRRDYFVARTDQGEWAWVFRDAAGWYLHGLFA